MQQKKRLMIWRGSGKVAPAPTPFPNTYSLDFDGIDEYLEINNGIALNGASASYSVSLWFNFDSFSSVQGLILDNSSSVKFMSVDSSTAIRVRDGSNARTYTVPTMSTGTWYHLLLVTQLASPTQAKIYLNGTESSTGSQTLNANWILNCINGYAQKHLPGYNFAGLVDEVSVFSTALGTDDIALISAAPIDLSTALSVTPEVWYRMGDSTKALYFNSIWQIPNEMELNFSQYSFDFDGIDDYISIYNGASGSGPILFDAGDSFSMSVWVKTSSTAAQNQIISFRGTALIWFYTFVTSGNIRFQMYLRDDSSNVSSILSYNTSSGWITPDAWTNLVFTRNGSTNTMNLYLNGVTAQVPTSDTTSDDFTLYDKFSIGNDNYSVGRYWFDGSMDSMSIWDKELSAGEVTAIYNSGVPTDLSAESNLVGYWSMEGATWIDLPAPLPDSWAIPDDSTNSNNGTTSGMGIDARINTAPGNQSQANSVNLEEADRVEDTP